MMNICSNCGTEYEGEFCPNCGVSRSHEKVCLHCGALVNSNVNFCNHCGYALSKVKAANSTIYAKLSRVLPCAYIFSLLIFSALLWAFYSAPVLNFLGFKLNVYKALTENVGEFTSVAKSLIITGAVSFAYSLLIVGSALIGKTSNVKIGKIYLPTLLSLIGNVFYLTIFVIACAMTAEVNKNGLSAESCCGLLISFSLIFAIVSVSAFILDYRFKRINGSYNKIRCKLHQPCGSELAHTDKGERKQRVKKERKARVKEADVNEIRLSASTPDKKLKRQLSAFLKWNRCVWLAEFIGLVILMNFEEMFIDYLQGRPLTQETLIEILLYHGDIFAKTATLVVLVLCAAALVLLPIIAATTPRLLKTEKRVNRQRRLRLTYVFSAVTFITFAVLFAASIILYIISRGEMFILINLITLIPCFGSLINFIRGIRLNKIFRFKRSKKSGNETYPITDLDAFCDGCVAYYKYKKQQRGNRH